MKQLAKPTRSTFRGEICGVGTTSGHRIVIGRWEQSPLGPFADVMVESPDGVRTLLAPSETVADFVSTTYTFDTIEIVAVDARRTATTLTVDAGSLNVRAVIGRRSGIGYVLRCVPRPIAEAPWWAAAIGPVAKFVMRGVRTTGTAGNGRREWYGASDARKITTVDATSAGIDLGTLTDVWPPVRFGFGSTPRRPSAVRVVSTVEEISSDHV